MAERMEDYQRRVEEEREQREADLAVRTEEKRANWKSSMGGEPYDVSRGVVVPAERTATEKQDRHRQALRTEEGLTDGLRENAARAVEIEADLLERAAGAQGRDVPQALRAVSDVKAKSLDGLLKITGRSAEVEEDGNLVRMLESMVRKGYLKASVDLSLGMDPAGEDA